jgi:hypothetical protein
MSQVVESAYSCQSCQQDLYKGEPRSHLVNVGPHNPVHCRPSFCVLSVPAVSLSASEYFGCDLPTASASYVFTRTDESNNPGADCFYATPFRTFGGLLGRAHIISMSPSRPLGSKIPQELWTRRKPDYRKLRIFGCEAYALVPRDERRKLESRSQKCIFLGYGVALFRACGRRGETSRVLD